MLKPTAPLVRPGPRALRLATALTLGLAALAARERVARACGGQCEAICFIDGCDDGYHYSWQQCRCVQNDDIDNGVCDDGYRCDFGPCGGTGERYCNTAATGCASCFDGYYTDGGGINEYGSFDLDGTVFCGSSIRCEPGCTETIDLPNPADVTFYVTGELEFGRSGPMIGDHHKKHAALLNNDAPGFGAPQWPAGTSGAGTPVSASALVMAGDMTYTDQGSIWTSSMCDRLEAMRSLYDHDPVRRGNPFNTRYPVFPGLGNHDSFKPSASDPFGTGHITPWDQDLIMTNYMDMRLRSESGNLCMGVKNYDGKRPSPYDDSFRSYNYSWDFAGYHLIQGNAWAGYLNPSGLTWLADDLATNVGTSGRPVIYIQHFGYEPGSFSLQNDAWWTASDREHLFQILDSYNVIALIHGHDDPMKGSHYTYAHGGKKYDVFRIPNSGKSGDGGDAGGFLAVRLRKSNADFSFFHYESGSFALSPGQALSIEPARYSDPLGAPACWTGSAASCSSSTLRGRGVVGPEPNAPNTVDACTDGSAGAFHADESIERLAISTVFGGPLKPGVTVRLEATVFAHDTADVLDFYIAPNAKSPQWSLLIGGIHPPRSGLQTLDKEVVLPALAGTTLPVLRAVFRDGSTPASACGAGAYDDTDDLVFAMGRQAPAIIYEHTGFGGKSQMLWPGRYEGFEMGLSPAMLSSVFVPVGLKVTLYPLPGFQGAPLIVTSPLASVGAFNDKTFSMKVEWL